MQRQSGKFAGRLDFGSVRKLQDGEWRFFYRDIFTMFLRWTQPIELIDGTRSTDARLMRRRVNGRWQYRALDQRELDYILSIENGTHC